MWTDCIYPALAFLVLVIVIEIIAKFWSDHNL